jgi:Xaa-Pro aminopeptidase
VEWLRTPDVGTGMLENRERIRLGALRRARRERVFAALREHGIDACLFGRESNVRYACGVRRLWTAQSRPFSPTCAIVRDTEAVHLLSFSASAEGIPEELGPGDVFPVTWNPERFVDHVLATPGLREARRIGVDGMTPGFRRLLEERLSPRIEWVPAEPLMRALRRRKLAEELACIRTAVAIAESALLESALRVAPGASEKELQAAWFGRMCELGTSQFAQQGTFTAIDPQGGLRWITGERALAEGSLVALAGGALWAGYEGSLARTWWCGRRAPSAEARALAASGREALETVVGRCRPGASGSDLRAAFEGTAAGRAGAHLAVGSLGMGHEGWLAGSELAPALEARERVTEEMVLSVRVFAPGAAGGWLGEEMIAVGSREVERLTTLGHGPLFAAAYASAPRAGTMRR